MTLRGPTPSHLHDTHAQHSRISPLKHTYLCPSGHSPRAPKSHSAPDIMNRKVNIASLHQSVCFIETRTGDGGRGRLMWRRRRRRAASPSYHTSLARRWRPCGPLSGRRPRRHPCERDDCFAPVRNMLRVRTHAHDYRSRMLYICTYMRALLGAHIINPTRRPPQQQQLRHNHVHANNARPGSTNGVEVVAHTRQRRLQVCKSRVARDPRLPGAGNWPRCRFKISI